MMSFIELIEDGGGRVTVLNIKIRHLNAIINTFMNVNVFDNNLKLALI